MTSHRRTVWDCSDDFDIDHLTTTFHYEQYSRLLKAGDEILVYSERSKDRAHLFVKDIKPLVLVRLDQAPVRQYRKKDA